MEGEGIDELAGIQKSLDYNLGKMGFASEKRKFTPHLTLGRFKDQGPKGEIENAVSRYTGEEIGSFIVSGIFLMKSDLKGTGVHYSVLHEIKLIRK